MKQPSRVQHRLLDVAVQVREHGYEPEKAFMSRELIQVTLPHSDPGDKPAWSRRNGNFALTIQPGWDAWREKSYGYPYGSIPRLLIYWIHTEFVRTGDYDLVLGRHLAEFMRKLGLDPSHGGKRGDASRLRNQMERTFRARFSFDYRDEEKQGWTDMQIAPDALMWWNDSLTEQPELWETRIRISEQFARLIKAHPVPLNMDALQALKNSPIALDFYALLAYESYRASTNKKSRSIKWRMLHSQMGSDYNDVKDFKKKAIATIRKIEAVYPGLKVETIHGGLKINPGATSIKHKPVQTPPPQPKKTAVKTAPQSPTLSASELKVSSAAIEQAKAIISDAQAGLDVYAIEADFYRYAEKNGNPKKPDKAFIGFVRTTIKIRKP